MASKKDLERPEYSEHGPRTPEQVKGLGRITLPGEPRPPAPAPRPRARSSPELLPPSEIESTPPSNELTTVHIPRHRQRTLVGPAAPPARGAAPEPPEPESKGSLRPAPWDDTTDAQIAAERLGYRVVRTRLPDASLPPSPPAPPAPVVAAARYTEPPWWRTPSGMVTVIGAAAAALVTSTAAIVAIIGAFRAPPAPAPTAAAEPCPSTVPPLQRSAFCVHLDQLEEAANKASSEAASAEATAARADRHADELDGKIPKIKGAQH